MVRIVSTRWFHAVCSIKWVRINSEGAFYAFVLSQDITQTYERGMLKGIEKGTILLIVDIENDIQVCVLQF